MTSLKRDKICPQCESRKLWHVERMVLPHVDERTLGAALRMAVEPLPVTAESRWSGIRSSGEFESFICAKCGFTEWYATKLGDLKADPPAGVHYIDAEPKAGLR